MLGTEFIQAIQNMDNLKLKGIGCNNENADLLSYIYPQLEIQKRKNWSGLY
jgi:hypothetical protein